MSRRTTLPLTCLAIIVGAISPLFSQDTPDEISNPPTPGDTGDTPEWLKKEREFKKMDDPLLELGDTGERVREIQATLNKTLAGQKIDLGEFPIKVGRAKGSDVGSKYKLRMAYSSRRNEIFQIRDDWILYDKEGKLLGPIEAKKSALAYSVKLPLKPLRVDGIFGPQTQNAVALFQHDRNLTITGQVDVVTLDKLEPLIPSNTSLALTMSWVTNWGIFTSLKEDDNHPYLVKTVTSMVLTLLILLAAAVVYQFSRSLANSTRFLSRWLFTPESSPWFTALRRSRVFLRSAQFAPAIFIYLAGRIIFPAPNGDTDLFPYLHTFQDWYVLVTRVGLAYASLVVMLVGFACTNAVDAVANPDQKTENPIGSIIRASKRLIGALGTLLILASLAGKSPFLIAGGLGAFMAVFMLVFKDYLLGLVSSVQIIANKVVQIGDWITMPKYNADGDVLKISLTLIKVQNFDKTISTIPTCAVLSESFQNWSGVKKSRGRRIKRALLIDMRMIQVCSPDLIERFERMELIHDYIQTKQDDLKEYNRNHDVAASAVNSRRLTNIGTFRAYLDEYLKHHPELSTEMTFLVRHLQPTSMGLPIEIYAFCTSTEWTKYEAVQADIFDHILAILPEFNLSPFQELSGAPGEASVPDPELLKLQAGLAEIESLVGTENQYLVDHPRSRPATRLQKVRTQIKKLDLENHLAVTGSGRKILLCHLQD